MKTLIKATGLIALALVSLLANAQTPAPALNHFSKDKLSFDYTADVTLKDVSTSGTQHLILTHALNGAQIMVIARYEMIDSPEQLATARKEVLDSLVDSMVKEFERGKAQVDRAERHLEVAGVEASGVRLRSVLDGVAGNVEIYGVLINRRFVVVSIVGSDQELDAAGSAWSTVRRSLKVGPTAVTVVAPETPDPGSVTGSNYTNKYFGLSLTFPTGWLVQDSGYKKIINDKGKELVASTDPTKQSELDQAVDNVLNLLKTTQYPPGTPGVFNTTFLCGAEKVSSAFKTDADYMLALKNTMQYSQVPHTMLRDVHTEQIGGDPFAVVEFQSEHSGVLVNSKYCAHIVKGYALFFILVYQTDEQLKVGSDVLESVVLR
jgi:hypothetical protein